MRMNLAALAVLLCYAAAPAATCDPRDQLMPLNEPEWTLAESGATTSRVLVAPNSTTQQTMPAADATIVLTGRRAADDRPGENTNLLAKLPVTSTAPEPQSRLLMVVLGFLLTFAGTAMLLLPRR